MSLHVILVEDDGGLRYAFGEVLKTAGYTVHPFADYHGVMELLAQGTQADILVVDIALSEGTPHGLALAGMVRMQRPRLPVVFISAYAKYLEHAWADTPFLVKPVTSDTLLTTVAAQLGKTAAG